MVKWAGQLAIRLERLKGFGSEGRAQRWLEASAPVDPSAFGRHSTSVHTRVVAKKACNCVRERRVAVGAAYRRPVMSNLVLNLPTKVYVYY